MLFTVRIRHLKQSSVLRLISIKVFVQESS